MRLSIRLTSRVPSTQIPKPWPCIRLPRTTAPWATGWMNTAAFTGRQVVAPVQERTPLDPHIRGADDHAIALALALEYRLRRSR